MQKTRCRTVVLLAVSAAAGVAQSQGPPKIGAEVSSYQRLEEDELRSLSLQELLSRGKALFEAQWTVQEGGGRPLSKGVGAPIADSGAPLSFPRNFNRVSAMDSNGCSGCHNAPFGMAGGGGDFTTGVFVAAQRFDFASFEHGDLVATRGSVDEQGRYATLSTIGNFRATTSMFGSGYYEMLARQITADLRFVRDSTAPGETLALASKGIRFGTIARHGDGSWDVSGVDGLPPQSLTTNGADDPPSLIVHPFHQSGSVVSLRQFTNNAFNHHHGMQSAERFGDGVDADGDGFRDELTRADIAAATLFQATLPVPGQVIPNQGRVEEAIFNGRRLFESIGCGGCHIPRLPLDDEGWIYTEPNPYNPDGNLQSDGQPVYRVDLSSDALPGHRLKPVDDVVWVPVFTDFKLHDITSGPGDPNSEAIDINYPAGSTEFLGGNRRFLTKRLWGAANQRPYFHHGKFTTLREATVAHSGEALASRQAFEALSAPNQARVIEFLKSLQVLPPGTKAGAIDEDGNAKPGWPPVSLFSWRFVNGR